MEVDGDWEWRIETLQEQVASKRGRVENSKFPFN